MDIPLIIVLICLMYCLLVYLTQRYRPFSLMGADHWCLSLSDLILGILKYPTIHQNDDVNIQFSMLSGNEQILFGATKC